MSREYKDFTNIGGKIITSKNWYEFPTLYHVDSKDNIREWTIFIRIVKTGSEKKQKDQNWNVLEENQINMTKNHLKLSKLDDDEIAQVWVETGIMGMKISRHPPSYFTDVLQGKANARSGLQQALIYARNEWLKREKKGGRTEIPTISKTDKTKKCRDPVKHGMYFPMLVYRFRDLSENINYPAFVQPKLDGNRCLTYLKGDPEVGFDEDDVIMYTRQHKEYEGFSYLKDALFGSLFKFFKYTDKYCESLYLDGEIYKHGMPLQAITSIARNVKKNDDAKTSDNMEYHIYDCFYPSSMDQLYKDRKKLLEDFYKSLPAETKKWVKLTETTSVKTPMEENKLFKKYLKAGYEGTIIRNKDSVYMGHPTKTGNFTRSKFVLKHKPTYDMEVKVVGYTEGKKGKDKGAIIWVCETDKGKQFNVTPKSITYSQRKELFKQAKKDFGQFKNRMMTIEYEDLSKDGIPLRAKALQFRDIV